jgi:hypothetical protein
MDIATVSSGGELEFWSNPVLGGSWGLTNVGYVGT